MSRYLDAFDLIDFSAHTPAQRAHFETCERCTVEVGYEGLVVDGCGTWWDLEPMLHDQPITEAVWEQKREAARRLDEYYTALRASVAIVNADLERTDREFRESFPGAGRDFTIEDD